MAARPEHILRLAWRGYLRAIRSISTLIGTAKLQLLGRASLGRGVVVAGPVRVRVSPGGRLIIGDRVRLQSGFRYNPVGSECVTSVWVGPKGRLEIRAGAGLSGATLVCMNSLIIGENTLIGGGTRVYDTDFHALDPAGRRQAPQVVATSPVVIGSDCFIGGYTTILKGVTVGDGSVVGACSVVARSVPPGEIWAGNPARFIRRMDPMGDPASVAADTTAGPASGDAA